MEKQMEKRKRYRKSYESIQGQTFAKKAFMYNDCGGYHCLPSRKFKYENQYKFSNRRQKEIENHYSVFNFTSSNNREVQNVSSSIIEKICPWSEEAVEEERKRQVSDTANELKNKLKIWNSGKSEKFQVGENKCRERTSKVLCKDIELLPDQSSVHEDNELNSMNNKSIVQQFNQSHIQENSMDGKNPHESRPEGSHQKSTSCEFLFKTSSHKSHSFSSASKHRQKKIQQSLIGELMAIPKANLKKLLANPQTHPKIEKKMAQIVKENRLILAQKFRSLAESKINQQGQFICSKFVDDVEDLIDSDLAVDLCQLPPELITQISDIFQLDFDCSLKVSEVQENFRSNKNMNEHHNATMVLKCDENSVLSASSTEDGICPCKEKEISEPEVEPQILCNAEFNNLMDKVIQKWNNPPSTENSNGTSDVRCTKTNPYLSSSQSSYMVPTEDAVRSSDYCDTPEESNVCITDDLPGNLDESCYLADEIKLESEEPHCTKKNYSDKFAGITVGNVPDERYDSKPEEKILNLKTDTTQAKIFNMKTSAAEKTIKNNYDTIVQSVKKAYFENKNPVSKSIETQTDINLIETDHSQPFLGHLYSGCTEKSLLREVQLIDDLLHRLNQRRFLIFLKLVGLGSCNLNRNNLKTSLMQAITNSDAKLLKELSHRDKKKGETKRNLKRKKNSDYLKNVLKKSCGIKNADNVNVINRALDVNI